ncbi:Cytochrome c oxidase assembly protein cox20, mitochondrial [Vanrija pseudolonga]|uniref:Cytochrome c oxidase assembly protein COX20, mitochondrial n=1 Tax=Vanrija pseudolonga TaxID=143232 RepID=A0AAF1BKB3_9TREE|nr:Cytochrome c oxidase assembly protein cox20, mitochondrial [Vanrija pseudolonga]
MSDEQKPPSKPALNIPKGNSPISPDAQQPVDEPLSGNWWQDFKKAFKMINVKDDFEHMGQWPCVRNALMYGIAGGAGIGAVRFLGSRRVHSAGSWAVATFIATSIGTRELCESQRRKELANMRMIQEKFPHRHVSHLKRKGEEWTPPKDE